MALDETGLDLAFDLDNPEAIATAADLTDSLVESLSTESLQALRVIMTRVFVEHIPPRLAAKLIVQAIGINEGQAQSLMDYQTELADSGVTGADLEAAVFDVATQMVNDRAETIARTETIRAETDGQEALWNQAVDAGWIDPDRTTRKWIATDDDRTCPECADLDDQETELDQPWDGPDGPVDGPPLHPNCRCAEGLVIYDTAGDQQEES